MRTSLSPLPAPETMPPNPATPRRLVVLPVFASALTRCECAGVTFEEIGRRLEAGEPLPAALARTGCGEMCTACRPDLESFLAKRHAPD